ncbi:hypothetical protein ACEUBQ_09240 [Aeromonas veronii]
MELGQGLQGGFIRLMAGLGYGAIASINLKPDDVEPLAKPFRGQILPYLR